LSAFERFLLPNGLRLVPSLQVLLRAGWTIIRVPIVALLSLLEPLFRFLLGVLAVLSLLTALLFATVSRIPIRSLVVLLSFALACAALRLALQKFAGCLSR
jgi:hypothetical protein